jgi:hypothetical protein
MRQQRLSNCCYRIACMTSPAPHNGLHLSLSCSELQERTHPLCCGDFRNNSCRSQMMALKSRFKAWRESAYESIATASRYTSLSATKRQNVFKLFCLVETSNCTALELKWRTFLGLTRYMLVLFCFPLARSDRKLPWKCYCGDVFSNLMYITYNVLVCFQVLPETWGLWTVQNQRYSRKGC